MQMKSKELSERPTKKWSNASVGRPTDGARAKENIRSILHSNRSTVTFIYEHRPDAEKSMFFPIILFLSLSRSFTVTSFSDQSHDASHQHSASDFNVCCGDRLVNLLIHLPQRVSNVLIWILRQFLPHRCCCFATIPLTLKACISCTLTLPDSSPCVIRSSPSGVLISQILS